MVNAGWVQLLAPDTPDGFLSAISARCPQQDQTRFDGSAGRSFRSARLRASPPAPENSFRSVRRRFKRQGSMPQFVSGSADGASSPLKYSKPEPTTSFFKRFLHDR